MTKNLPSNSLDPVFHSSITTLIRQGKHEDAWNQTLVLDDIFRLYYQIQIRLDQGHFIESLKLLQVALDLAHNSKDPSITNIWYKLKLYQIVVLLITAPSKGIDAYNQFQEIPQRNDEFTLGMTNLISGFINNDINYFQASIDYFITLEELIMLGLSYVMICHFLGGKKAIQIADQAIGIFEQFGHKNAVNSCSCLKGSIYQTLGDYKTARVLNTKAFEEHRKKNYDYGIANACLCLGLIAIEEGKISEAIQKLELSSKIFYQDLGYNLGAAVLVEAYRYAGMYKQGLEMSLETLDRLIYSPAVYELFFVQTTLLVLEMGRLEQAKELYERFKTMVGPVQDSRIENSLKLCEALILKQSKSLKTTYKAQDMLRELLQSTEIAYQSRVETIKHLCELLLLEYELYENEAILQEVQGYITTLSNIAQEQNLIRLTFESRIISSKLELLKKNFVKARQILVGLHDYASENNLSAYEQAVSREIAVLDENYSKWMNLMETNASMREFMEKTNIKNYMTNAIKKIIDLKQD